MNGDCLEHHAIPKPRVKSHSLPASPSYPPFPVCCSAPTLSSSYSLSSAPLQPTTLEQSNRPNMVRFCSNEIITIIFLFEIPADTKFPSVVIFLRETFSPQRRSCAFGTTASCPRCPSRRRRRHCIAARGRRNMSFSLGGNSRPGCTRFWFGLYNCYSCIH